MVSLLLKTGCEVVHEGGAYFLSPSGGQGSPTEAAQRIIDAFDGIYLAGFGRRLDVAVQGVLVVDEDGSRSVTLAMTARVGVSASVEIEVISPEGSRITSWPQDSVDTAVQSLLSRREIAEASALLARRGGTWSGLYNVIERLQVAGLDPVRHGMCSRAELDRFTQTANSCSVLGEDARHAKPIPPPTNPMTLHEAQAFVRGALLKTALAAGARDKEPGNHV